MTKRSISNSSMAERCGTRSRTAARAWASRKHSATARPYRACVQSTSPLFCIRAAGHVVVPVVGSGNSSPLPSHASKPVQAYLRVHDLRRLSLADQRLLQHPLLADKPLTAEGRPSASFCRSYGRERVASSWAWWPLLWFHSVPASWCVDRMGPSAPQTLQMTENALAKLCS